MENKATDIKIILRRYLTNGKSGEEYLNQDYREELSRWQVLFRNILQPLMKERGDILRDAPDLPCPCCGEEVFNISRKFVREYIQKGNLDRVELIAKAEVTFDGNDVV